MKRRRGRGNTSWARGGSWRGLLGALATIVLLVGTIRAQQPLTGTGSRLSKKLGRQIEVLLPEFPSAAWIGARNGMGAETVNLPQGSAARQAAMRRSHGVDGTGVGIGVLSTGVARLVSGEAAVELLDRVMVLPGQAGEGDEGTETLSVLHQLAPGSDLYFATGLGGPRRFAANIQALCQAGADIIVDDLFDYRETIYPGGRMAQGIQAAVAEGCVYVSAAGKPIEFGDRERQYTPDRAPAPLDDFSTTEDPKGSMSNLSSATCLIAANPDLETFCGSWASPRQVAALAALIIEEAGGAHNVFPEALRAAVVGTELQIGPQAGPLAETTGPAIRKIRIRSDPPQGQESYGIGDLIEVEITFSEAVNVTGTPQLGLRVGRVTRVAGYSEGAGTTVLTFSYTVAGGDEDSDGLSVKTDNLWLNNGTIEAGSGNHAELTHPGLPHQLGHRVDAVTPSLLDSDAAAVSGSKLTLSYDELLDGSSTPSAGDFRVMVAGKERGVTTVAVTGNAVTLALASPVVQGEAVTASYAKPGQGTAKPIRDPAGNESMAFTNQAVTNRTGEETKPAGGRLPARAVRQIQSLLSAKVRRTPAQRKVSSQLLEARRTPRRKPTAAGSGRLQETDRQATEERVMVDIRADVTPAVLTRIRELGGTVINSVPKYQAIRAQIPLRAGVRLAALDEVRTIRPADEARTRGQAATLSPASRTRAADAPVTKKDNTSQGDVAHRANSARRTHNVDGTGIGVGVIANGVRSLADRQATDDLPARVTVLPGQEGSGDEGTALLEIVHDLAPGAELYFATGNGGEARMAENIEALCEAGANVIVDDIGYALEAVFQDGIVSQGVNAAVADGCFFFSAGGNDGNLTYRTTGVWEGDYAAGSALVVDGETVGIRHDFGGGAEANEVRGSRARIIVLQWADPLGASANDYDLFLVNEDGDVSASSTDTQDGTQDPIEVIRSPGGGLSGLGVVVVKASGSDRYLRVHAFDGRLGIRTAGNLYGHAAAENAVVVAMVDVRTAAGSGRVFNGTESVRTSNSDGPRRIFFEPDGTAITAGNFSSTGGQLLQKPDLTAATCVRTATPGFSTFCGTSSAAPHGTAIAALMLEAAGGPNQVTLAQLRTGMTTGAAVLDIEAAGVDRDSGAGIVMAPGSVDAVDVAAADRNRAPTVENAESDRTFAPGDDAVDLDLEDVFDDPDDDALTYEAISSYPARLSITRSNAQVTMTPGSPGRVMVRLRAIDPDGLSVTDSFSVTVTAGNRDYDSDNDGLIDIANLAQLDALRYDLNGDGLVDGAIWMPYYTAYPMGALGMGCPSDGCAGYELTEDLDFDTDDDGDVDSDDDYWNGGDGWEPIGEADTPFIADFKGNRQTVSNLFIDRDTENEVGLFGAVDSNRISGVSLAGADVTGRHAVGSLLGAAVYVATLDNHATGQVSGQDEVGGLVGRTWGSVWYSSAAVNVSGNDAVGGLVGHQTLNPTVASRATGQVSGQDEVGGLVGRAGGEVWHSSAAVNVSGNDAVGGLVGHQTLNPIVASYATGNVEGMEAVGGLVGAVSDVNQIIEASYATGNVSGRGARLTDSDSGFIICDLVGTLTVSGPVAATTSSGGGIGGLAGSSCGHVQASYATGAVSGTTAVGGLVGSGRFAKPRSSYWDPETSGVRVGVGEDDANDNGVIDGTERVRLGVGGKTTAELQTPTDYTGIYEGWNVDLGNPVFEDGEPDDPWDFGTATQYPVLSLDLNDDNRATWQEVGYQVRTSLTLRAATTANQAQVDLSWNALSTTSWSPAPDVSYTLYRDDGATIEAVGTNLTGLTHTDTGVTIGDPYTYWVAAVLDGGEAVRSAPVSVTAGGANQPPLAVGILPDRQLTVGSMAVDVDVASAFQDPDNDTLTYGASSSLTSVATLSRSGSLVTITPVAAGRTIITVTATDVSGSDMSASQRFRVKVGQDYDTDGDGLIGISNLAQLDAMRHDLDGNGDAGTVAAYAAAFPSPFDRMGCGVNGCSGYELLADLDFDTDGDGAVDSDDYYWNDGDGWEPIGWDSTDEVNFFFNTRFDGNQHTLSNLFVAGRGYSGLFGRIGRSGVVRDVTLSDVNVSGTEAAGALVGENQGLLIGIRSSGQVSGELHVGGLVGYNTGFVVSSHATGRVTSDRDAGGLVGYHRSRLISASYATGPVTGAPAGGLVGTIGTPSQRATIRASYATGSVDGSPAGGLVGHVYDEGMITASYATGRVSGGSRKSGLVGDDEGGTVTNSYWDTRTSGQGSGSPGSGRTTSQLQSPTSYSGIYRSWNVDLNEDDVNDDPWDFGTSSQYPALRADRDGDDDATWEEFGYQLRSGPTLTATPTTNAGQGQVELEWAEVPLSSEWTPAPRASYTVTREGDENLEAIAENLTLREYTDTDVAGDETYVYQVVAVVDGGEPVRSATVSVTVVGNKRPLAVGTLRSRWVLVGNSVMTELGGAFQDPEGDTITYDVSSSDPSVARVTLSGTRVTIIPVAEGRTTITVTATDDGSSQSRSQQFRVTVLPTTTVDYDTDDDGLIEISNLAQLDAVRHDLNGSGRNLDAVHAEAFPDGGDVLACGGLLGCVGYELNADLDFDTDRNGEADAGDTYWNDGAGWLPIGDSSGSFSGFGAIFEGNGRTITNLFIDSSENDIGLFGVTRSSAVIRDLELVSVLVTGTDNVGGLVGSNGGAVSGCFATGKVSGDDVIGGLVGANLDDGSASASYSTVQATGDDRIGGLAGSNRGEVTAAYATGRVVGDAEAGGLLGRNSGDVNVSYATGRVSGRRTIGGLVGWNSGDVKASYATGLVSGGSKIGGLVGDNTRGGTINNSYWDTDTSGPTTVSYGRGQTTANLQAPTDYTGIYQKWNRDLDGDGLNDAPWDFGTPSQYPALSVDTNGVGGATWQEFGQQIRAGPALMATPTVGQVTLTWSAISGGTYNLYRTAGTTVEILAENTSNRTYVDTDVTAGATYVYQVAVVVNGGEGSRSPRVSVEVPMPGVLPTATLELSPAFISENGGSAMVTAKLSHTSSETTTVTVSATANSPAVMGDFTLSANRTLTIAAGQANSTGTVTIRANNNNVHAPDKTVRVSGSASNNQGVTNPGDVTLTIVDDDTPTVTLELSQTSISENGGSTTVTARLSNVSSEMTTVTVSATAVAPAVSRDFTLTSNKTLMIMAGHITSTGTVTITANDNDVDTPDKTVRVSGMASNSLGVMGPAAVTLTLTDDDDAPAVTLELARTSINENRGFTTVRARLNRASSETTTVSVSAAADSPAVEGDFTLSTNNTLTITAGRTTSTGTVRITANNNDVDTPDKTVRVSGTAGNSQGVTDPADVKLTITDDDAAPTVTLELSDDSISEDGGASTVTAKLNRASSERTTVTITATPVDAAAEADFRLSANKTLTITAGQTTSTGTVTIRANDNNVDTPDKTVRISGTASNSQGVTDPSDVTLTITDDDAAPVMTLEVSPAVMAEAAGSSTVTVRITNGVTFAEAQEIRLSFSGTAEKGTDYRVESERLTLTAGESSVTTPVTSVDDEVVDVDETILITATHDRNAVGTQQTLTITDDDAAPAVTTTSPLLVEENETAVATLAATDADHRLEDLEWEIAGGTDRSKFTLTAGGELAFKVAKDYENPDDANRDGDYEITVRVSDGANRAEADFIVRLQDVDDIAPEFSAAVADGSTLTLAYSEALDSSSVPGTDAFTVTGGNATRTVSGVRVIGSAVELTLDPAVEHGQTGIRVSYTAPTGTGATPIQDTAGNDADSFNNRQVSNNTGDTTGPAVETVSITSNPGSDATYAAGETIQATVTFDETVVVTGRPRLTLKVGGRDRTADYQSVTGGAVRFEYQVVAGDSDPDGVSIEANRLSRGGGTIRDGSQNDALLEHDALADNTQHKVDGVAPVLVDPDAAVVNGATLTLTYDEALNGSSRPATSAYTVSGGSETPTVTRVRVNESAVMLTLVPAVEHGETDLRVSYRPGANPIQDLVGNEAGVLTDREVDNRTPDTTAPSIEGIELTSDPGNDETYAAGEVIAVRVRYNEPVRVDTTGGTPTLNLTVGNRSKTAGARSGPESPEVVFVYEVERGEVDEDGVSIPRGRISLNGGTIRDDGNNNAALSHDGLTADSGHRVDGVEPKLQSATVHASRLALSYDEALDEDSIPSALDFTVVVAGNDRPVIQVQVVSGNGVTLRLSSPVTAGETVTVTYTPGVNPIRDEVGNAVEALTDEPALPPLVTILAAEGARSVTEGTEVQFTLTRELPTAAALTVGLAVTERGEVIQTGSYQPPDEVTFTVGDTTASLTVLTEDDEQQESDGAVIATLQPGPDYRLGQSSTRTAQVTVEDDEGGAPPGPIGPGLPPVPNPVPSAPRNLEAVGGDEQVTLSWEAPEDDGGFAITDYEYLISGTGGGWISTGSTETSHTVTELTNGRVYLFQVRAVSGAGAGNSSNRVEVTPGVGRLEFAHFANGSSITSELVLVNVFARPIRPSLYFYNREGERIAAESVVELTEELEVAEDGSLTVQTEMQPLQALTISTHGQGEVVAGSVTVLSNGPLGGVLRFDLPGVGVAGVGAGQPLRDALFPARRQAGGISTAVAIRNLQEEELVMTCQLMQEGAVLEEVDIDLQAKGQDGRFIEEVFTTTDTTDFVGMVRCTAPAGKLFAGVAVELDAGNGIFTTLPVLPVDRTVFRGGEYALDFAHFANGASITSDLVLVNVSIRPSRPAGPFTTPIPPTRPSLYFYDRAGERLAAQSVVEVEGDLELAEDGSLAVQTEMQPLQAVTISTHGQGEVVAGSVRVVAEGPLGGVLRFDLPGVGVAGVGAGQAVRDALFPARRQEGGISTAAAIRNLEAEELVVSCRLMQEGEVLEEVDIELQANGQDGRFIEEVFTRTDTTDFVGLVRCTAEGEFAGVAVELDAGAGIFTTLPVVPVPGRTSRE